MGTKFAANSKRRNSPAWCKKGMFTGITPEVDGKPVVLAAYARWSGTLYTVSFDVIDTLRLRRNGAGNGWEGETAPTGDRLKMEVLDTPNPQIVHVHLSLFRDNNYWDDFTWHNVTTQAHKPWGTFLQLELAPPGRATLQAQVLA